MELKQLGRRKSKCREKLCCSFSFFLFCSYRRTYSHYIITKSGKRRNTQVQRTENFDERIRLSVKFYVWLCFSEVPVKAHSMGGSRMLVTHTERHAHVHVSRARIFKYVDPSGGF